MQDETDDRYSAENRGDFARLTCDGTSRILYRISYVKKVFVAEGLSLHKFRYYFASDDCDGLYSGPF